MAWNDRLREAAYTSPSGVRVTFDFEDVSRTVTKKTTGFDFPDADGTYVQDLGHSGRQYPLQVFFWGSNYDLAANLFEGALLERGIGKLEHPVYGVIDVIPFGAISRRDDLKTAANQAVVQVTFWETIGLIYPTSQEDPADSVITAVDEYNAAAAAEFAASTRLGTAVEQARFRSGYLALFSSVSGRLQALSKTGPKIKTQFDTISASITTSIDLLIAEPRTLAAQTTQFIQVVSRAKTDIDTRLTAYGDLAASILGTNGEPAVQGLDSQNSNDFHNRDLYAATYVTGGIISVVNTQFDTKTGALSAADTLLALFADWVAWHDDNFQSLGEVDAGSAYQQLQEAVALTAGFLVEISFDLKTERRITLDRERTIVDLAAELYGSVDDQLDFLINSNNLSGSEILELPRGREIVYYV